MSLKNVTAGLKGLSKADLTILDSGTHLNYLQSESDRAFVILQAAALEDHLSSALKLKMQSLNSDEMTRLFDYNGPVGTFSAKISMAQALGIIDRSQRKRCDLLRDMRNVCAHGGTIVNFSIPEMQAAALQLLEEEEREGLSGALPTDYRNMIVHSVMVLMYAISRAKIPHPLHMISEMRTAIAKRSEKKTL